MIGSPTRQGESPLCPRVGSLGRAHAGEQILFPQKPLAVAAPLTELDRAGTVRTTAGNEQLHISCFIIGYMIALDDDCVRCSRGVLIVRRRADKIGERQIGFAVTETVVEEGYLLSVQGTGAAQPV